MSRTLQLTLVRKAVGDVLNRERIHEKIQTQFRGGRVLSSLPYSDFTRLVTIRNKIIWIHLRGVGQGCSKDVRGVYESILSR
jgi:hypothetical protein